MSEHCFEPLTPIDFVLRSADVFGDRIAVIDAERRMTYGELGERVGRLAGALRDAGVKPGDRVAVLAPNTSMLLEAHFGVPMAGAVLVALNTRLAPAELAYIIDHAGAATLLLDHDLRDRGREAVELLGRPVQTVVAGGAEDEYESFIASGPPTLHRPADERGVISLNYTSGTTGSPKGVMYHHRGAYLQSLAMMNHLRLDLETKLLWTLPMFHCNGWTFPWAVTAAGGTHVCLRDVEPARIWQLIRDEAITHFNAAPTVLTAVVAADEAASPDHRIRVGTGGAPPSPALLRRLHSLNIEVVHLYGLTETFGPAVVCDWRPEWDDLPEPSQARLKARQGVANLVGQRLRCVGPDGTDVASDGETLGEVALRGNNIMLGYYRDDEATRDAVRDGWFYTGDLAVVHADGYIELRDRKKDVVISGGENISSIQVEQVIAEHAAVAEVAVVGVSHPRWGERPVAVVTTYPGAEVSEQDIIDHVRGRLAAFKAPDRVLFSALPKTSTGKVEKFRLRALLDEVGDDADAERRLTDIRLPEDASSEGASG